MKVLKKGKFFELDFDVFPNLNETIFTFLYETCHLSRILA